MIMSEETRTRIIGVRTVGVPVSDQDQAVDFYAGQLGLEVRLDVPSGEFGGRWIEVGAPGSDTSLALVPAKENLRAGVETGIRLIAEDAPALHADLKDRGIEVGELLRWPGVPPMFAFRDPDGNGLEVVG
jgi:lactoylglutathione lyase